MTVRYIQIKPKLRGIIRYVSNYDFGTGKLYCVSTKQSAFKFEDEEDFNEVFDICKEYYKERVSVIEENL